MTFIPLYDHTGTTQLTCAAKEWGDVLSSMRTETVIKATGIVQERPENDQNKVISKFNSNGKIIISWVVLRKCLLVRLRSR